MSEIISFLNTAAPAIVIVIAIAIVLGVLRVKSFLFFILILILLPFLVTAIYRLYSSGLSSYGSWESVVVLILIALISFKFITGKKNKK